MLRLRRSELWSTTKIMGKSSVKLCVERRPPYVVLADVLQLMNSNRYGESRAAYREVQERHEDIKRIEQTLAELAQLFNDVSNI